MLWLPVDTTDSIDNAFLRMLCKNPDYSLSNNVKNADTKL